jgi:hypothetical protein
MHPVEDPVGSAAAGRPIFIQQERVQIIQPGNPNQPVELVRDDHRQRWPEQYAAFRRGEEVTADGTPLEQWPVLNRGQVLEMKAMGLHTVQQCAGLSDLAVQKIGMGGARIRELAKAYLDEADQMAITTAALDRAEKAEARLAQLEAQAEESRTLLNQMHAELMQFKNRQPEFQTYVPGQHDPLQPHNQPQGVPQGVAAASSLDSLGAARGRPRTGKAA